MSLLRKALVVNAAEFICLLLSIAQAVLLARFLGPTGVGQYAVVISAMALAAQLFSLGMPLSYLYHAQREPEGRESFLTNALAGALLTGTLGGMVLLTIIVAIPGYFGALPAYALVACFLFVPLLLLKIVARNTLLIRFNARCLGLQAIVSAAGGLVSIIVLCAVGWFGVGQAIICFTLAALVGAIAGWHRAYPDLTFRVSPTWRVSLRLLRMGVRQCWADLMVLVNAQVSVMLIKCFLGDFDSVGFFDRGQRVALLVVTAGQAVLPLLFSRWASLAESQLASDVERVMRFVTTMGILTIVGILFGGKWVILVMYGHEFLPAVAPMVILVPGAVLYLLSRTLMQLMGSRGAPELSAAALMVGSIVNACATWLLIARMDIAGAAWASVLGNLMMFVLTLALAYRKYGVRVVCCVGMTRSDIRELLRALSLMPYRSEANRRSTH